MAQQRFLNTRQLAQMIGLAEQTLINWRSQRTDNTPPFKKLGGKVLYDLRDVNHWISENTVTPDGKRTRPDPVVPVSRPKRFRIPDNGE